MLGNLYFKNFPAEPSYIKFDIIRFGREIFKLGIPNLRINFAKINSFF
jgi:hypothetical protein